MGAYGRLFIRFFPMEISEKEIIAAQQQWGQGIVAIGEAFVHHEDYRAKANSLVHELYAYGDGPVLFKPTKAAACPFRRTEAEAISYFVQGVIEEDRGFAIQPWAQVRFENADIALHGDSALAMGNYYFTDRDSGEEVRVEYNFGYHKDDQGAVRINLHHSSMPYHAEDAAVTAS